MAIESHLRSLVKAVSWRIFGTFTTMVISYIFTGKLSTALFIGLSEFVLKVGIFYVHERVWHIIPLGLSKQNRLQEEG
jgi:adenylylsulfate kinase